MAMIYEAAAAALVGVLLGGLPYWRWRRIRTARARLELPAAEVESLRARKRGKPSWVRSLPENLDLDIDGSLFEALYDHFGVHPNGTTSAVLALPLAETSRSISPVNAAPEAAPESEEERIKGLLSSPTDPAVAPPSEAFTQNFVLNLVNVLRGRKPLKQGLEHAVLDSIAPGAGFAGAKLGGAVGLALAPWTVGLSTVFVPATVAAGAWLGAWAGKRVGTRMKARRYFSVLKRLRALSREFQRWFVERLPEFLGELDRAYEDADRLARERGKSGRNRFARTLAPDLLTVFHHQSRARLREERAADRKRFKRLIAVARAQDPVDFAYTLDHSGADALEECPEFTRFRRDYRAIVGEFRELESA